MLVGSSRHSAIACQATDIAADSLKDRVISDNPSEATSSSATPKFPTAHANSIQ